MSGGTVDSEAVVKALVEVDPGFVALCDTLFGKAVDATDVWAFLYTPEGVRKMSPGASDVSVPNGLSKPNRGVLVPKVSNAPAPSKPPLVATGTPTKKPSSILTGVGKADDECDVVWAGEFSKFDTAKRQAFGWASVVEIDGAPIVDLQGDFITPDDIEDAAYAFVQKSRIGGTQHARDEWDRPIQAGTLIESMVFTPEKIAKMGLPAEFPVGWWTGFQYEPGETWDDIAKGAKTGFSVHGRGKRMPVSI